VRERPFGAWRAGAAIAAHRARRYLPSGLAWAAGHAMPLFTGLLLKAIFDRVSGDQPAYATGLGLLAVLVAVEAGRGGAIWVGIAVWPAWWQSIGAWIRSGLLESVLCDPGPPVTRLPSTPGEAVGRLRDDVEDLIRFVDIWVDIAGAAVFTAAALVVMARISVPLTAVALLPLAGVLIGTRALSRTIRRSHERMRERGSSVTGLIADLFAGVLALKTAGAEARALARLEAGNAARRHAAVRAQLAVNLMQSFSGASAQVTTGLLLLLAAGAMRQGGFSVGDLALFTSYAATLTNLPRWLGRTLGAHREAGVALGRLARFDADRRPEAVVARRRPVPTGPAPAPGERLRRLEVRGLTARHPGSGAGVFDVDLTVEAGALTVVTGVVGSGKTTLIRALLGLLPAESGSIRWNGAPVADPGAFLVPPRVAYAGQVARLFSATLAENVALGWPAGEADVLAALRAAQLAEDLAEMPAGLATVIGSRGSRLSGGQLQRAAVARALVRVPDLLVLDDVSSALDQATEERLWRALAASGLTCLVASHRPAALERAGRVVVLDRGRVVSDQSLPVASLQAATAVSPSAGSGSRASSTEREVGPANERA